MSAVLQPLKWFYREFGLNSIRETGRNAYLIILARSLRMVANGGINLILALFLSALGFEDYKLGLFMTLTLVGDVFLGGYLTLVADRTGRRKVLLAGSFLMVMSGTVFALSNNFWVLLVAAIFGVVSATGGDFGPFRSIEESILSHLTNPQTRADVLAWYVTTSTFGAAVGSEVAGRVVRQLTQKGWTLADAYHILFWSYTATGLINAGLTLMLTDACELDRAEQQYSRVAQDDHNEGAEHSVAVDGTASPMKQSSAKGSKWYMRFGRGLWSRYSQLSAPTRKVMYKLWFLLAVDSLADGMVPYTLTNLYLEERFQPSKSTLGDVNGVAYVLGAVGTVFAGPLSRKIGLINTMVFTHIPSSAAVLVFPAAPNLVLAVLLLFVRAGLNNMDQAPRSAFIAGVVRPEERTAAMGIAAIVRTLAATAGPSVTGLLADSQKFWIAFVVAGACRLVYDVGLYAMFVNTELHQYENEQSAAHLAEVEPRRSDEEEMLHMDVLDQVDGKSTADRKVLTPRESLEGSERGDSSVASSLQVGPDVRRRSPSPAAHVPRHPI